MNWTAFGLICGLGLVLALVLAWAMCAVAGASDDDAEIMRRKAEHAKKD